MARTAILIASCVMGAAAGKDASSCCWCDDATPDKAKSIKGSNSETYDLVREQDSGRSLVPAAWILILWNP